MGILHQMSSYVSCSKKVDLNNKLVLITGGSSGIGLGFCNQLSKTYPQVTLVVVDIHKPSFECIYFKCDLSKSEQVKEIFARILEKHGVPDIIVFNAGVQHSALIDEVTDEQFERIIDVNFKNIFFALRPFLSGLKERKRGHLIFTCSVASFVTAPGGIAYSASKAAQLSFANGIRAELHEYGVKVSTLSPGHIKTSMFREFSIKYAWLMPSLEVNYVSNAIFDITQNNSHQQWRKPLYTVFGPLVLMLPPLWVLYIQKLSGADLSMIENKNAVDFELSKNK